MKLSFNNKPNPFYQSLKSKVDAYFELNKLHPAGNFPLYVKGFIHFSTLVLLYTILVFFTPSISISIICCMLLGLNFATVGFNIMHEGGHGTFSKYPFINVICAYTLNFVGGNAFFWKIKHNINHHTYTNIEGFDPDIDIQPFLRTSETQPKLWIHQYQQYYCYFLYGISYFVWVVYDDSVKYFSGSVTPTYHKALTIKNHIVYWATKFGYFAFSVGIPSYFVGVVPAIIGYAIMAFTCGLTIAMVFQLAHVVEDTAFPMPNLEGKIEKEWAIHQLETTANFGTKSKFLFWMLGGLNFQIEHHLFPKISHIHYPALSKIVKETCDEYGLNYHSYPNAVIAFQSHLKLLASLGAKK